MNADVIRKVEHGVMEATYNMSKETGRLVKPPAYRVPYVRFRIPNGFDAEEFAEEARKAIDAEGVNVFVKIGRPRKWITVSYSRWKPEYTERIKEKRREGKYRSE